MTPKSDAEREKAIATEIQKALDEREVALGPRENPVHPMFRDHNCAYCDDGKKPCKQGSPNRCDNPRARND